MKFLRIKEWAKYQHYRDRNPPWIKLHQELLTSVMWVTCDDASRMLAIACMLLAARTGNKIPLDRDFIQRSAYLKKRPDVRPLVECGFAEILDEPDSVIENTPLIEGASNVLADASEMLAKRTDCYTRDRDRDREIEREKKETLPKRATRLPEDFMPSQEHYLLGKELGINTDMEFQKFRDYFLGVPGTKGVKLDWSATLRNWLRNSLNYKAVANDRNSQAGGNTRQRTNAQTERADNNIRAVLAAFPELAGPGAADSAGQAARHGGRDVKTLEGEIKALR